MSDAQITISGPGGCINNELYLIQTLLESEGYIVSVQNSDPAEENIFSEERLLYLRELRRESPEYSKIKITMDHQPWGG